MEMKWTRRECLVLGVTWAAAGCAGVPLATKATNQSQGNRTLGRTGLQVSEVGMGVMLSRNPALVQAALDAGVTYFDTARSYSGGRNEAILAQGLGSRRKEVVVATKCHNLGSRKRVLDSAERSLKELRSDYIDVLQLHGLSSRDQVLSDENRGALADLRKAGKIRFAGVTTHTNMAVVMDAAVEAGDYDVVLTSLNFRSPPEVLASAQRAAEAGLGVVAMKVMTGGYAAESFPGLNPYQSALRWVLQNPFVATTIPSMATFEQVRENTAVMGQALARSDASVLNGYAGVVDSRYCRACGTCAGACPLGTDLPAALRGVMYAEGYGETEMGRRTVAAAKLACGECAHCVVNCRFSLDLSRQLALARELSDAQAA